MPPKYIKCVDGKIICSDCHLKCVKNGFSKSRKQRYKCQNCEKTYLAFYTYKAYSRRIDYKLIKLLKDGVGIRGIGRLLEIFPTTVQRRILRIAKNIRKPMMPLNKCYELDEMCTYISNKNNRIWIAYAIRRDTKSVVDFNIGKRTNRTLRKVVETLQLSGARKFSPIN